MNYKCTNDRYDNSGSSYASVREFLDMCAKCFQENVELRRGTKRDGTEVWRDQHDEIVLVAMGDEQL